MKNKILNKNILTTNRILLGLVMLIPGLSKLGLLGWAGMNGGPSMVIGMLSGLGFPIAGFFAWILILSEVAFGIAILANWKVKYTALAPAFILIVASFTAHLQNPSNILVHLALASNYLALAFRK